MPDPAATRKARDYQRKSLQFGISQELGTMLFLIVWSALAPWLAPRLPEMNRYVLLFAAAGILYLSYQLAFLPLDYLADYRLEHRYGLSTETPAQWLWHHTKSVLVAAGLLGLMLAGLYSAMWYLSHWAVWCWVGWVGLSVVLAQVFPVLILPLFYPAHPLEDSDLLDRLRKLAEGTGIAVEGVYRLELSRSTRKGNAMLAGLGRTRRVLLGDTLLDRLGAEEIAVVFAHELGHHVHRHFAKGLVLQAAAAAVLMAGVYLVLGPAAGPAGPPAEAVSRLPVVALVLALFTFLARPLYNAVSRHFERQCDRYALARTADPDHFAAAFEALADQNLADPDPPRWVVVLYYDHPPIAERIALARPAAVDTTVREAGEPQPPA